MQEEIFFQGENIKTKLKFFTTFSGQTSEDDLTYYLIADSNNQPLKLVDTAFQTKFGLNPSNYNIPLSAISGGYMVYTGSVVTSEILNTLEPSRKQFIIDDYITRINSQANADPLNPSGNPFSYVFFEDYQYNDYFLNVKLNRSLDVLNTLNVYNVPTNESIKFSNDTGVLYGKIDALQLVVDDNGNKIKIPIKKASVGIFNSSDEFPSVGSVDEEGNRIKMNLFNGLETINDINNLKSYGSFQSYIQDVNYSTNEYLSDTIPEKYKYTTFTNDNGEFILHNIPTGQQTLMIEVDLLKQGLEPEEVALNFFPYPLTVDPNVSTIPHLYFNQIPVQIIPSWGEFQTGYTEINLTITLDLRKWITYFTYPIASAGIANTELTNQPSNIRPKVLEELYREGVINPFTVKVRDMTKRFDYNNPEKIEIVKILDIFDKNLDLKCAWNEEFKVKKNKIEFDTSNYNAFKLPANLYDPNGINTNGQKGVWLGAYQIKTFYGSEDISFQSTGWAIEWIPNGSGGADPIYANHYDLNWFDGWNDQGTTPQRGSGIGTFPYERPWSLNYPEPYKITNKPSNPNPLKIWDASQNPILQQTVINANGISNQFTLTKKDFFLLPRYLDGDMVGGNDAWSTNANGYGLQNFNGKALGNNFSREVTKNEVWKYEKIDHWAIEWSNGYNQVLTVPNFDKYPNTPYGKPFMEGERYQRLEAGYAYWLKPNGWPRINNQAWGDLLLSNDFEPLANHDYNSIYETPNSYISHFPNTHLYIDEINLIMGANADRNSKFGRLNIYRIEKPYYVNGKKLPFVPKFARFHFGFFTRDEGKDFGTLCRPGKTSCDNESGGGDTANCYAWFQVADPKWNTKTTTAGYEKYCESKFWYGSHAFPEGLPVKIYNIGSQKIKILETNDDRQIIPSGNENDAAEVRILNEGSIILPANDSYDPQTNTYNSASYLIRVGNSDSIWSSCAGPFIQPIYKYQVGTETNITNYYLNTMISREVGFGGNKCKAIDDYNTVSGINWGNVLQGIANILLLPALAISGLGFIGPVRDAVFDGIRENFTRDNKPYGSEYRNDNNIGVFINGITYVFDCYRYSLRYLDVRGPLPYIGEEVKESSLLDIRNNVPYFGNQWWNRYRQHLNGGAGLAIFQPKRMYENNLKGRGLPYYMEYIKDDVRLDYTKAFE